MKISQSASELLSGHKNLQRGNNSIKKADNGSCSLHIVQLYFIPVWNFIKIPVTVIKINSRHHCQLKIIKGHNSLEQNVGWVFVCNLCTLSRIIFVLWKYLKGFKNYLADTISKLKFSKGHNSIKSVGRYLICAHRLIMFCICTLFCENIS